MFKRIPQGTFFRQGKINSSRSRDSKYVKKRGCNTRNQSEQRIFSQSPVLSREKGRGQRPVINLKELSSHLRYQQKGENSFSQGYNAERGLDDQNRSDRCLFYAWDTQSSSKIPSIQMEREKLSVQLSPIWNSSCTSGVHKNVESTNQFFKENKDTSSYLPRRHIDNEPIKSKLSVRCTENYDPFSKPRIWNEHGQISSRPYSRNSIFGIYNQFDNNVHNSTKKGNNNHSEVMHRCSIFNISYCKEIVRIDRNFNSFDTSSISSTTPLSVSSNGKKSKTLSDYRLQCRSVSKQRGYKRIKLVDPSFRKMEWENFDFSPSDMYNSVGCQQTGLGAVHEGVRNGGPWLELEKQFHINALQILAVTHAVKSFLKKQTNLIVLVQTDNKTTIAYINKMGAQHQRAATN